MPRIDSGILHLAAALVLAVAFAEPKPSADAPGSALPHDAAAREESLTRYAPTADYRLQGEFLLSYDGSRRCPRWTLELLDRHTLSRNGDHERPAFHVDDKIPARFAASPADYEMSGYDKGHCTPAEDMDHAIAPFTATFTMANVMPQHPNCNRGVWKALESYVRRLAVADGVARAWVLTAPAWKASDPIQSRAAFLSYARAKCIGRNQVYVPTHCVKAVLLEHETGGYEMQSWIVPNIEDCRPDPKFYKTSAADVERLVGLDLWHGVPGEERLEANR